MISSLSLNALPVKRAAWFLLCAGALSAGCDSELPECSELTVGNEPLLKNQWHIDTDGSPIESERGAPFAGADAGVKDAWESGCLGQGVLVAVIDDGVETSHPDFSGRLVIATGTNYNDGDTDDPGAQTTNGDYHGTAVAGIIAAADNGKGVIGIAPRAKILPIRLIAGEITPADEAAAILRAAELGADIISNSWGPPDDGGVYPIPDIVDAAIWQAATEGRNGKGISITWAAGNGSEIISTDGYASHPAVIAVGATTDQNTRAYYSDYGPEVFISAPSSGGANDIWTTDLQGAAGYKSAALPEGDYTIEVIAYTNGTADYENNYGNYTLTIGNTSGSGSSYTEQADTGEEPIDVGQPVIISGTIDEAGESDFYRFAFPGTEGFPIRLETVSSLDFDFIVYNSQGTPVTTQDAPGNDSFETESGSGNYTGTFGGTSAATPMVSGVIAMLYSYQPGLTRRQVRKILKNSAGKNSLNDRDWPFESGHSQAYGYGKVDAYAALVEAANTDHEPDTSLAASVVPPVATNKPKQKIPRPLSLNPQLESLQRMYYRGGLPVFLFRKSSAAAPQSRKLRERFFNGRLAAYQTSGGRTVYVGSEVNAGLFDDPGDELRAELWQSYGLKEKRRIGQSSYLLETVDEHIDVFGAAQDLLSDNKVRFAAPNISRLLQKR